MTPSFSRLAVVASSLGLASLASARNCMNLTVEVAVDARNAVFNLTAPANNIEVTNLILDFTRPGHNLTEEYLTGYATIQDTYTVAATYCEPDAGPSDLVQLLTHGVGYDRTYWDLSVNDYNYSYVALATDEYHYSTFAWDRLGVARSQHGEAVNEIQSALEISALYNLTMQLREGTVPGVGRAFDKVLHVGHSFGSIQTYSLAVLHPEATDGLILTGFAQATSSLADFALGGNYLQANTLPGFGEYPDGYVAVGDVSSVQTDFFGPGQFAPELLTLGYSLGQPATVGELLTLGAQAASVSPLTGPVLIITGGRLPSSCCCSPPRSFVKMVPHLTAHDQQSATCPSVAATVPTREMPLFPTTLCCPSTSSPTRAISKLFWWKALGMG